MAYDIKFRKRAIEYKKAGHSVAETLEAFKIGRTTLYKWIKMSEAGKLSDPKPKPYYRKIDPLKLEEYVKNHPDSYQYEIAEHFACRQQSIAYKLKKLGITRKKRLLNTKSKTQKK